MSANKPNTAAGSNEEWIDPDDAPELDDAFFERADHYVGGKLVKRGRPPVEHPKERVTLRLDHDVAAALRNTGKGWQTRVNEALREWLDRRSG